MILTDERYKAELKAAVEQTRLDTAKEIIQVVKDHEELSWVEYYNKYNNKGQSLIDYLKTRFGVKEK
jgi:hypothetical protein